jgi:hypothetical protein
MLPRIVPVSRGDLLRYKPEPVTEVAAFGEHVTGADRGHHRARDDGADAGYRHQPHAVLILTGERFNLVGEAFDARIQVAPVSREVPDQAQHAG